MSPARIPEEDWPRHFWSAVDKTGECWEWRRYRDLGGYGEFAPRMGRKFRAHRYSYEITFGPIPDGMIVCHRCDNPPCVRPDHLFAGTHADNARDRDRKGRASDRNGELHPMAKLTEAQAIEVHRRAVAGEDVRVLAQEFSIHESYVYSIKNERAWARAIKQWRARKDLLVPVA